MMLAITIRMKMRAMKSPSQLSLTAFHKRVAALGGKLAYNAVDRDTRVSSYHSRDWAI